jgi:hypothetical protein
MLPADKKPIQESLGDSIIETIHRFADTDLDDVQSLQKKYLFHVEDAGLRQRLAETLYGARWIYKLGLVLLVRNEKQMAHVRAQVIDYCSVCEGVLSDMVAHGVAKGYFNGNCYRYHDFRKLASPLDWSPAKRKWTLENRPLAWLIAVAREEQIINQILYEGLEWMRKQRNTVHVRAHTHQAYLTMSHSAFQHMASLFKQTQEWKRRHP